VVEVDPNLGINNPVVKTPLLHLGRKHFSDFLGSAQRLPNGNNLICEGGGGRFLQMTPNNEVVWEYVNPYLPAELLQGAVFKIKGYASDYCPQMKNLAPAGGSAVEPPDNAQFSVTDAQRRFPLLLVALIGSTLLIVSFLLGWKMMGRHSNQ